MRFFSARLNFDNGIVLKFDGFLVNLFQYKTIATVAGIENSNPGFEKSVAGIRSAKPGFANASPSHFSATRSSHVRKHFLKGLTAAEWF